MERKVLPILWLLAAALAAAGICWGLLRHRPEASAPARARNGPVFYEPPTVLQQQQDVEKARALIRQNSVPIHFWGKIVDQEGRALPGAEIRYNVRSGYEMVPGVASSKFTAYRSLSDKNGLFEINGPRGDLLEIESVSKEGYYFLPGEEEPLSFVYAATIEIFHPDPVSPVIFALRQKDAAPP